MKKLLLIAAVAVFGLSSVNAQEAKEETTFGFEEGNILLEGNLGFNTDKSTYSDNTGDLFEEKTSSFNFNPKAGYFISDDFVVGLELYVASSTSENTLIGTPNFVTEEKGNSIGVGVFARYYFLELGKRFKTYGEFGVGFNSEKYETSQTGAPSLIQDNEFTGIGTGLGLGINYFISDRFAINFGLADLLSFSTGTEKDNLNTNGEEINTSTLSGNFNVFNNFFNTAQFGLTYKF